MAYTNGNSQTRVGVRIVPQINASTLWNSIYSVYNADSVGSSSLKTSLVAAYNGESNTNDSFGTNHGTAVGGLTYTTGKIGNAFNFNGTNAIVTLPQNAWNFTSDFSFSLWVNLSQLKGGQGIISNSQQLGGANGEWRGWFLRAVNNKINFMTMGGGVLSSVNNTTSLSINVWYHVSVTHKTNVTKLYINGVLEATNNTAIDAIYHPNKYPPIGNYYYIYGYHSDTYFNGKVDAINAWQKELTQSEITELYNSGNGAQYITDSFYKPTTNDALNTYNGTAQGGLTYGPGKIGTAFQFNGTNAYVQLGDVMDVGTSSWSYSMWFNANSLSDGTYFVLFSKSLAAALTGRVWITTYGNKMQFNFDALTNVNIINTESTTTFNTNTWYHLVCVLDRNDKLKMYINGMLILLLIDYVLKEMMNNMEAQYYVTFKLYKHYLDAFITENLLRRVNF